MRDWHELFFEGSEGALRAFVVGFAAGRGARDGGVFGGDIALEADSFGERLKALFTRGSHHVVFVPDELASPLAEAVAVHGAALGIRLDHRRIVQSASFEFRIEVFSRDEKTRLRTRVIAGIPQDARIENLSEQEETHPEARGPEPFAPLHAYTYRASGRVVGVFGAVVEHWRYTRGQDFTEISRIAVRGNPFG